MVLWVRPRSDRTRLKLGDGHTLPKTICSARSISHAKVSQGAALHTLSVNQSSFSVSISSFITAKS